MFPAFSGRKFTGIGYPEDSGVRPFMEILMRVFRVRYVQDDGGLNSNLKDEPTFAGKVSSYPQIFIYSMVITCSISAIIWSFYPRDHDSEDKGVYYTSLNDLKSTLL